MILLWLLVAVFHVSQAKFEACPENSACLYHAYCVNAKPNIDIVLATTKKPAYDQWVALNCSSSAHVITELFVRPLSDRKWNFTFSRDAAQKNDAIILGDSLTIMANGSEVIFKSDSDVIKIPYNKTLLTNSFTVKSPVKKLLDIIKDSDIFFFGSSMQGRFTSSKQPKFLDTILELTPCDDSLVIDDCKKTAKNCTVIGMTETQVGSCEQGSQMWMKSDNSTWTNLLSVFCEENKKWSMNTAENGTQPAPAEGMEIRCANEEPEPWTASLTGRTVNPAHMDGKKEEPNSSLIHSPITWVGIAVGGIIALAALALAIGYAYRKLWKHPPTGKSTMSNVSFQRLPQEKGPRSSESNSEADLRKDTSKPTPPPSLASQAPAAIPQEVSRADAPTADTVNRLSLIKTIREDENVPQIPQIPEPSSN